MGQLSTTTQVMVCNMKAMTCQQPKKHSKIHRCQDFISNLRLGYTRSENLIQTSRQFCLIFLILINTPESIVRREDILMIAKLIATTCIGLLFLLSTLSQPLQSNTGASDGNKGGLAFGVVRRGHLFVTGLSKPYKYPHPLLDSTFQFREQDVIGGLLVWKVRNDSDAIEKETALLHRCMLLPIPAESTRVRARFCGECYWGNAGQNPAWSLAREPLADFDRKFWPIAEDPALSTPNKLVAVNANDPSVSHIWRLDPFSDIFREHWKGRAKVDQTIARNLDRFRWDANTTPQPLPTPPGAFMDYLPVASDKVLFFLRWQSTVRVWEAKLDIQSRESKGQKSVAKMPVYTIAADWSGPFFVLGSGTDFLFVTESGRMYGWHGAGHLKQEMVAHWESARRIHTLVTDSDANRTWAFASASGGTLNLKSVYFLLDSITGIKGEPKEYKLTSRQQEKLPGPVRDLLPYIKILQDNGEIESAKKSE